MDYQEYLKSEHWQAFRLTVLEFWSNRCCLCCTVNPEVHHRHYNSLGRETLTDCIALCRLCHEKHHTSLEELRISEDKELGRLLCELGAAEYLYRELKERKDTIKLKEDLIHHYKEGLAIGIALSDIHKVRYTSYLNEVMEYRNKTLDLLDAIKEFKNDIAIRKKAIAQSLVVNNLLTI